MVGILQTAEYKCSSSAPDTGDIPGVVQSAVGEFSFLVW